MKRMITMFMGILLIGLILHAQEAPPQAFSFKATIKDSRGLPVLLRKISLRISVLQGDMNGLAVYSEYFNPITNLYSQVDIEIGRGTVISGSFPAIDWSADAYYLKIEADARGGTNYQLLSVTQLLSVPYALFAGRVMNNEDNDADPLNEVINNAYLSGTDLSIQEGGTTTIIDLSGLPDGMEDADADPANEIQVLSLEGNMLTLSTNGTPIQVDLASYLDNTDNQTLLLNDHQLTITNGNTIQLPDSVNDADHDPTNELQELALNNTFISISGKNTIDLAMLQSGSGDKDNDPANEIQALLVSFQGDTLKLSKSNWVIVPGMSAVNNFLDKDNDKDGYTENQGDCDDIEPSVNPEAYEIINDGVDQNCDGYDYPATDTDGDGILDIADNCPMVVNPGQADDDLDGFGNACDIVQGEPITDVEGNVYKTVVIGGQTWMAENLKTRRYNDGTVIPSVWPGDGIIGAKEVALYIPGLYTTFGIYYGWISAQKDLCPTGWHVPNKAEYLTLINFLGGNNIEDSIPITTGKLKEAGNGHWVVQDPHATNSSGFTALAGGSGEDFLVSIGYAGSWWTTDAVSMMININEVGIGLVEPHNYAVANIRCVKNETDLDNDGFSISQGDCDDSDNSKYPDAAEICGDGIDQNCNGKDVICGDNDGDGYTSETGDCNNNNPAIHPGATEYCGDGIDRDCDGMDPACPEDIDSDGYSESDGDCNDNDPTIYPGATEICGDGIDQNCDGINMECYNEVTDIDGNTYPVVQIGSDFWMAENLKVTRFNDGTELVAVSDNNQQWSYLPAYCWYEDDEVANKNLYGALYNVFAITSTKELCPSGWIIPNYILWDTLIANTGGINLAGSILKEEGTMHWLAPNDATNESGFTALPGGLRNEFGTYENLGESGYWWSKYIYVYSLFNNSTSVSKIGANSHQGYSVRCVKDPN